MPHLDDAYAFARWLTGNATDAEDVVQEACLRALNGVGTYAGGNARAWLLAIVRNTTFTWMARNRPKALVLTDDLEPFERLKLHILNLGHTVLADIWRREGRPEGETVREILADPAVAPRLAAIYADEVLSGFAAHGMEDAARAYVATTMDRFRNPYLDHRIADIAGNHALKVERRIAAFLDWAGTPAPILSSIVSGQRAAA